MRSVPNSCTSPTSVLNGWPASATSSPIRNTRGSRRISSAIASFTASPYVSSRSPMTASSHGMRGCGTLRTESSRRPALRPDAALLERLEVERRRHQGPRVGLLRLLEDPLGRPLLDHAAVSHDEDLVADGADHLQVVTDEQVGEPVARLQLTQEVDDLRLHRHVERGGRLVEDEEARLEDHGAGDGDALALAPGEFMWVAIAVRGIHAHLAQRFVDEIATLGRGGADAVDAEAFADDLRDGHARRQRSERILEDDLHLAAQRPQRLRGHAVQLEPAEADPALARLQAEQGQAQRRLARAALAHHADRLALAHGETHPVAALDLADRAPQQPAPNRKPPANVLRLHHDRGVRPRGARNRARLGGEQAPGVGVTGRLEDCAGRARLDDLARAHHAHAL